VKLPIRDCHLAGKDKCDWPGQETEHDRNTTDDLQQSPNPYLRHQRGRTATGHSAKPAKEFQRSNLKKQQACHHTE